ncbi:collagenase 3-like isoform X2 [Leuresthes tenuis]|uniref:collagenase 3-like isoform X2 n=1 Tax=Leuresthes tenuis TaxID=355514 RepID=UPI003B512CA9
MGVADFGILLLACLSMCHAAPIVLPRISFEIEGLAKGYLSEFYGGVESQGPLMLSLTASNDSFSLRLRAMQAFFGLEVTGALDNNTLEVMKTPRCGVPDVIKFEHISGKPKWHKQLITYRITQYTPDLTQSQVDATIAHAFRLYSDVIPLDFKQVYSGTADIMILFQSSYHGDMEPFDGPFGQLAHAYPPGPGIGGDSHFDEDETWTLTQHGTNLLLVAAHEFGHALGLDHSRDRNALMFPTYQYVNTDGYRLPDDDRRGVQALYGTRTQVPTTQPRFEWPTGPDSGPGFEPGLGPGFGPGFVPQPENPIPLPNPQDQQCSRELGFDAVTSIWGDLYFFKNGYYWWKSSGVPEIRFFKVSTTWPQISYVDAALEIPHKQVVYLFQGHQYWAITSYSKTLMPGYPQPITNFGLPSSVRKVDAAVYEGTIRRALIFVNDKYWSYDDSLNRIDFGFPRYISHDFSNIGSKVDAAFENYGYIYFVDGPRQSQFYLPYRRVTRVLFNYEWLNCDNVYVGSNANNNDNINYYDISKILEYLLQ